MRRTLIPALALAALLGGCENDPSDVVASDLYGLWGAISMIYTSDADPGLAVDVVGTEGATYSIELIHGGTYASSLSGPQVPTTTVSGDFEVRDGELLLFPSSGPDRRLEIDFNQSLLTLREEAAAWDFDGDGTPEPATLEMVLDRF